MESHLMFRVRRQELEGPDGEPEFVGVGKLPDAHTQRHELVARDVGGAFHDVLAHVIHSLFQGKVTTKGGS